VEEKKVYGERVRRNEKPNIKLGIPSLKMEVFPIKIVTTVIETATLASLFIRGISTTLMNVSY
jgi:hypothetical protein